MPLDLLVVASQLLGSQCFVTTVVPAYRCGAAPDSHRVPSCDAGQSQRTDADDQTLYRA